MMHCDLRFKYRNFSRLVVSSTAFGEVVVRVSPLPSPLVAVDPVSFIYTPLALPWQSRVSFHNLPSRVRAIVCSENDLLFLVEAVPADGMDGNGLNFETNGQFFKVLMPRVLKIKKFVMVSPL